MTGPARDPIRRPMVIALFVAALVAWALAGPYTIEILTKLAIFAIFALSIDFLVGYVGLITMGHAGFLGVGAYVTAYFAAVHGWPVGLAMVMSVVVGALAAAFVIAGTVAALAGSLHAQQNNFVNPQIAHWMVSGEGLIFVIVGGMGTLVGPIIGTAAYIVMESVVATFAKQHALIWMGLFFVTIVLVASDGIYGRLVSLMRAWRRPPAAAPDLALGKEAGGDA